MEISLVLLLNKMIDSLFMYLSAAKDYSFLRDRICIFIKNEISCCKLFFVFSETVISWLYMFLNLCLRPDFTSQLELRLTSSCFILL